jgi:tetratricopeptide (TPR) repeat protein
LKCKNCGTDNPDDLVFCEKCGKPFYANKFKLDWKAIVGGVIAGFILLLLLYLVWGKSNTFYFGVGPALIFTGAIAGFLSYNKNVEAGNDLNQVLQGIVAGLIVGLAVILALITADPSSGIFLIFIPSYLFWAFIGGCIGGIINLLRQKNKLLVIPFAITVIIAIGLAGYLYNDIQTENNYEKNMGNTLVDLAFNELLELEAESYLNETPNNSSNLKEAQIRYQRMIELTNEAILWNQEVLNSNPTPIRKEYSQAMSDYLNLKLDYYTKMEKGIELTIKKDLEEAKTQYNEAKKLIPQIKKQEKLLETIQSKDPEFKNYISNQINISRNFAQLEKRNNELLTFPISPPENN